MRNGATSVLDQFRSGDPAVFDDAFHTLFQLHQRAVYGWILRLVRNPAAAEDLTVETFWRIYRAHARFNPAQGFEGWARRIATNLALDWLRRQQPFAALDDEPEPAAPAAADPAITAEIRCKTALAFNRLPVKLRAAATLAVVEGQPHKQVAEALGISVTAVKVRVFRALRLLRIDLERQGIRP